MYLPFEFISEYLHIAEKLELSSQEDGFSALRSLGLEDFGDVLWNMPSTDYPKLSAVLPKMTPEKITKQWTGATGRHLLEQSVRFVRSCAENFTRISGDTLENKKILDFGCGYGRFLRLFSYYSNEIYGVDAWEVSLNHSRTAGFNKLKKVDAVCDKIPFDDKFDFLFAFSVFTHLSEESTIAALNALRKSASYGAILAITIRPIEFWKESAKGRTHLNPSLFNLETRLEEHRQKGFTFLQDENVNHYGDTSITIEWINSKTSGWKIEGIDRSLNDSLQRYVFLRAI